MVRSRKKAKKTLKKMKLPAIELYKFASEYLEKNGVLESNLEAKYIVSSVLGVSFSDIFLDKSISCRARDFRKIKRLLKQRTNGKPLQYVLKEQEFFGLRFYVDKRVLIPRSETELLVEKALEISKEFVKPKILDLCTGSGCIAVAIAENLDSALITASDISGKALRVAKKNARANGSNIRFYRSDLLKSIRAKFDIIVTNPPYINSRDYNELERKIIDFEPKNALDGGEDGADYIRKIVSQVNKKLFDGGYLVMEIGYDQKTLVSEFLKQNGYRNIKSFSDYSGFDRIVMARK